MTFQLRMVIGQKRVIGKKKVIESELGIPYGLASSALPWKRRTAFALNSTWVGEQMAIDHHEKTSDLEENEEAK